MKNLKEYDEFLVKSFGRPFFNKIQKKAIKPEKREWFRKTLERLNPKSILEIGRYKGYSFGMFKFMLPESYVLSIDVRHFDEVDIMKKKFSKYDFVTGTSCFLRDSDRKFDFVFIDGDHSYEAAKLDWANVLGVVQKGSVVVFDDLPLPCGKVFKEIDGHKKSVEGHIGSVIIS